jgi:hypothetical protein
MESLVPGNATGNQRGPPATGQAQKRNTQLDLERLIEEGLQEQARLEQERLEQERLDGERLEREKLERVEKEPLESEGNTSTVGGDEGLITKDHVQGQTGDDHAIQRTVTADTGLNTDQQMRPGQSQASEQQVMFKFSPFTSRAHFYRQLWAITVWTPQRSA